MKLQQTAAHPKPLASILRDVRPTVDAPPRRRRRSRRAGENGAPLIPIVDANQTIVAWTETAPVIEEGKLRHAAAERLLGGAIFCTQIALADPEDIRRAGGPPTWRGAWRCLALCRLELARGLDDPAEAPPIGSNSPNPE